MPVAITTAPAPGSSAACDSKRGSSGTLLGGHYVRGPAPHDACRTRTGPAPAPRAGGGPGGGDLSEDERNQHHGPFPIAPVRIRKRALHDPLFNRRAVDEVEREHAQRDQPVDVGGE